MRMIARGFAAAMVAVAVLGHALAQQRGAELAALAAWAAKSSETATIDGRVARALGLNADGRPIRLTAVTTPYLDGARSVYLLRGPEGERIAFSQGQSRRGTWMLSSTSGELLRAVEWMSTSANPQPVQPAAVAALFAETKAFWKAQLGTPARSMRHRRP